MADDELHAVIDDLVGDRYRLLRLASVVVGLDDELLAVHAAVGVDEINRGFRTDLLNRAVLRDRTGFGAGERDGDGVISGVGGRGCGQSED